MTPPFLTCQHSPSGFTVKEDVVCRTGLVAKATVTQVVLARGDRLKVIVRYSLQTGLPGRDRTLPVAWPVLNSIGQLCALTFRGNIPSAFLMLTVRVQHKKLLFSNIHCQPDPLSLWASTFSSCLGATSDLFMSLLVLTTLGILLSGSLPL